MIHCRSTFRPRRAGQFTRHTIVPPNRTGKNAAGYINDKIYGRLQMATPVAAWMAASMRSSRHFLGATGRNYQNVVRTHRDIFGFSGEDFFQDPLGYPCAPTILASRGRFWNSAALECCRTLPR